MEPPFEDPYQVRFGMLMKACDDVAKPYAPNFTSAGLSLSPENKLVIHAPSTQYELALSNMTLSQVKMPNQLYTGNWLVSNEDGTLLWPGSIDLLPPD